MRLRATGDHLSKRPENLNRLLNERDIGWRLADFTRSSRSCGFVSPCDLSALHASETTNGWTSALLHGKLVVSYEEEQAGGMASGTERDETARPRILIVEDEPLIALMLTDMLAELGFQVTASVAQVADALAFLANDRVDIALLDVNIGAQKIDPVADLLAARGTPFIFTTGYGTAGVPANHADRAILQKPFHIDDLAAALRSELGIAEG